jgi:succinate dehydrogenase hydrophobic membrane anchor protein
MGRRARQRVWACKGRSSPLVDATRLGGRTRPAHDVVSCRNHREDRGHYTAFVAWVRNPITDILMGLLLIALFYHAALGLQVIVEDYVHSDVKFAAVIAVRLACFTLGATGILATLHIALGP